jgi:hypothetical protein
MSQKTLLMTVFHPFITKNILNTDAFKTIKSDRELKIVLAVPDNKSTFFKENYERDNVRVIGVPLEKFSTSRIITYFHRISWLIMNTHYLRYKRRERLDASYHPLAYLKFAGEVLMMNLFSGSTSIRKIFRGFFLSYSRHSEVERVFDEVNPDVVFSTDAFDVNDSLFAAEARRRGLKLVTMVRSWDNCYSKGVLRVLPDKLIVNNKTLKQEAIEFHDVPEESTSVLGSPQYDTFVSGTRTPREEFFRSMGLDPNKKLILFAPAGTILSDTDTQLVDIFKKAIDTGGFKKPVQFLIRNHPNHPANLSSISGREDMVVEDPGKVFNKNPKDTELTKNDNEHMADELYYADMVVWVATTLGMDAIVFDKPQIAVDFDGYERKPYNQSVRRYHDEDHMKKMLALGGVSVAYSAEELIELMNHYLEDPSWNREGRERVKDQQFYKLDGQAGKRIGEYILSQI